MAESWGDILGNILGFPPEKALNSSKPAKKISPGESLQIDFVAQVVNRRLGLEDPVEALQIIADINEDIRKRIDGGQVPVAVIPAENSGEPPYVMPLAMGVFPSRGMVAALRRSDSLIGMEESTILSTYVVAGIGRYEDMIDLHYHR
jgi:hypothetical protein